MTNKPVIAVVGMSGVFPGAVGTHQFWKNIVDRVDMAREVPAHRWGTPLDWVYRDKPEADRTYSRRACLVEGFRFDPKGFDRALPALDDMEPLYQWVLHSARDAWAECRTDALDRSRAGVILAAIALPTGATSALSRRILEKALRTNETMGVDNRHRERPSARERFSGRVVSRPASVVAWALGLGGDVYTLDAACASSLYAVRLACDALQHHRADAMICGGVSGADGLYTQIGFSQLRALSPSGRCAPFDRSADGLVVGEGAGILVLKRLADAQQDGDTIYGVIRGIGLSNDMRGNLLAPESDGQVRAMRAAYAAAEWAPWDVDYIECHGAGTPVGDATELQSLRTLWEAAPHSTEPCAIGSVKSMIGHLLTGAGAAGLIKTLLGLHHGILPPSLNFTAAGPDSPLADSPFHVQTLAAPWPEQQNRPARAAVSAFGFGGINAHVLLEACKGCQTPSQGKSIRSTHRTTQRTAAIVTGDTSVVETKDTHRDHEAIAIVGMEVCLGRLASLKSFQHSVFSGSTAMTPPPEGRWKVEDAPGRVFGKDIAAGGFIQEVAVALGEFQIPPGEIPDILPQQLLMLKVAAAALADAGLPLRQAREGMGAVIGIGFDYEATNFHLRWVLPDIVASWDENAVAYAATGEVGRWWSAAREGCGPPLTATRTLGALGGIVASRIAREFRFGAPSFVVSAEEASGLRALAIAVDMLRQGQADVMLAGAVDLVCDERNLVTFFDADAISGTGRVRPFDVAADGGLPGEGAVALVLKRLSDAVSQSDRIYAVIQGVAGAHGVDTLPNACPAPSAYVASLAGAIQQAKAIPGSISLVETHGSGIPAVDDIEAEGLQAVFAAGAMPHRCVAVGALKPLVGNTGAAAGLASLAKTALCLFHHLLPPVPNYFEPRHHGWRAGCFHFPRQTAFWPRDRVEGPRTACVGAMTADGGCMHAVLQEPPDPRLSDAISITVSAQRRRPAGPLPFALFLVHGNDAEALMRNLDGLSSLARESQSNPSLIGPMENLAHRWFARHKTPSAGATLAVVAHTLDELDHCIQEARQAIPFGRTQTITGRTGVCHLPEIQKSGGEAAFVFPGSGNHYVGMGRRLSAQWPEVLRAMDNDTERLQSQMLPHLYDPRRSDWGPGWQSDAYKKLVTDPLHCIFGQVIFGGHMARLLKAFGLRPQAVIGYSLGESAGLFAMDAWPDQGRMLSRLANADLFQTQLAGPCDALRRAWKIPPGRPIEWRTAVVNRPVDQVDAALAQTRHVRRLIINTPNECVIGGLAHPLSRVLEQLQCEAVYLDGVVTVHCDAARPVAEAYRDLHRFPTTPVDGVRFYSCAAAAAYPIGEAACADAILGQALYGFDFSRTIRQAHDDGVRVFIEVGPQASCTRMIRQILDGRPHLAVGANMRGEDECLTLLKCLGTAAAAGLPVDLAPLYGYDPTHFDLGPIAALTDIRVRVGGRVPLLPPMPEVAPKCPDRIAQPPFQPQETTIMSTGAGASSRRPLPPAVGEAETPARIPPPTCSTSAPPMPAWDATTLIRSLKRNTTETAEAHQHYLDLNREMTRRFGETLQLQTRLMGALVESASPLTPSNSTRPPDRPETSRPLSPTGDGGRNAQHAAEPVIPVAFTREQCLAFAVGAVGQVLGPDFDVIDTYPVRVRLPDEPLMLVDRILSVEGRKRGLGSGRVVTEHDVRPDAWYLDGNRAPVCISVEAGQADLFLSSYLGIDHQVKGERTYRLLDATIRFHRGLPQPGETIRYDIHIDKFVRQGATYLFFFRYQGHIDDTHLITMTNGCAGFFTEKEVNRSGGIILSDEDRAPGATVGGAPFSPPVALESNTESYTDTQVTALRRGDAGACFGPAFAGIQLPPAMRLPSGRMQLIHRIVALKPRGGRFGRGYIKAEADIRPDDWFLTCHFVDDQVMPGTLMYECCAHALRVLLLRFGWVTEATDVCYEPVPELPCRLKCRGPVTPRTRRVHYAVEVKEIGYRPEPYVVADAHMYADGRFIVFFKDMSMQITGLTQGAITDFWTRRKDAAPVAPAPARPGTPLFTREQILEFAVGRPSRSFGEPYRVFDSQRTIARLPGPPYCFMDRITRAEPPPWVLKPDGWVEAAYDVPADGWYFDADRSGVMPFCVLLEIALQPCGWLAAYAGSALKSTKDLKFRNLGGEATQHANVPPAARTLTMRTRLTKVSEAVDMIIEHFDFEVLTPDRQPVYTGKTHFGFFTALALSEQKGLRKSVYLPGPKEQSAAMNVRLPAEPPLTPEQAAAERVFRPSGLHLPAKALAMIDAIDRFCPDGGPEGLGYIQGRKTVDPDEWFFKAHFHQDPVCPGSLGVESFIQLIKFAAMQRWPERAATHRFEMACGRSHTWQYRGQVIPANREVRVEAVITDIRDIPRPTLFADGWLHVDGLCIYKMDGFGVALVAK